jgi:hypothetical protein
MEGTSEKKDEYSKDPFGDDEEMLHFKTVVSSYFNYTVPVLLVIYYQVDAMRDIARMDRDFNRID